MSLDAYVEHVRDLLDGVPDLRFRRMFGGVGVYSGGQMFALVASEQLYLKTDLEGRDAFSAAGSEPFLFDAARGRTTTTSYWRIPASVEEDPAQARRWALQALEAAHRAKQPKRRAPPGHDLGPGPWDD